MAPRITRRASLYAGAEMVARAHTVNTFANIVDHLRRLATPRLITFVAATHDINATAAMVRKAGYQVFGPRDGSRKTPSGEVLSWRTLGVLNKFGFGGVEPVPFFIQWGSDSPHPSQSAPTGCELEDLRFEYPDPSALEGALKHSALRRRLHKRAHRR